MMIRLGRAVKPGGNGLVRSTQKYSAQKVAYSSSRAEKRTMISEVRVCGSMRWWGTSERRPRERIQRR